MSAPVVSTEQGKLLGKTSTDLFNNKFYSFQGIPFAKPPLGELRFKAPQPAEPWSGTRDATQEGETSYSKDWLDQEANGSEDCLYLNVYTPQLPTSQSKLKPVMVWIHGGAFRSGSGNTFIHGPEYLLTEDIVLVTFNYRLGIFGFLQFQDPSLGVPGNAGLKDMVMALKWVQRNISNFSGDRNNVTLFGESAGAVSTHILVLSPLAKGLFHKAIVQSGTAINSFALARDDITTHLAKILQLKTEQEIYEKLINHPADELFAVYEKVQKSCSDLGNSQGRLTFGPLLEQASPEAVISENPIKIVRSGAYNKVPMIFGYTTKEGMLMEVIIKPRKPEMPQDFEAVIPITLGVETGSSSSKDIADKIKNYYYGEPGAASDIQNFYRLHTDNSFVRDILFSVQLHTAASNLPVYLYRMSVETSLNLFKNMFQISSPGVCHADDLGYLFKSKLSPPIKPGSLEEISVRRFVKLWTHFARSSNPNSEELTDVPEWTPVREDEINFIDIGEEVVAGTNPEAEMMKFWRQIFGINRLYNKL